MDRIRGSKGNKVLKTRRIALTSEYRRESMYSHFCSQSCLFDYIQTHKDRIIEIQPRREALETKIKDPVKDTESYWNSWKIENRV
jgi:hypothetical protein